MDGIKGAGNDLLYGYLNSASSFYNTLANIPGGFRKLSEFANNKFGNSIESVYQEDPEKGLTYAFEVAENYLRGLSVQLNPHSDNPYFNKNMTFNMKPTTPDTFLGKLYSAFGAAPVTVGEYIPATRLLKSMPLGFATTDALRAADQGVEEAGVADVVKMIEDAEEKKQELSAKGVIESGNAMDKPQSNEKVESTGWLPKYTLHDGIKELIMAYQIIINNDTSHFRNGFPLTYGAALWEY